MNQHVLNLDTASSDAKSSKDNSFPILTYKQIQDINWMIADTIRDHGNGRNEDTIKVALPLLTAKRCIDLRAEFKRDVIYDSLEFEADGILYALSEFSAADARFAVEQEVSEWFDIEWSDIINFPENPEGDLVYYRTPRDADKSVIIETHAKNKIEFLFQVMDSFKNEVFREFALEYEFEKTIRKVLKDQYINQILVKLNEFCIDETHAPEDLFADAYMDLTARFASEGGKKGGEFFTPSNLTQGGVALLDPDITSGKHCIISDITAGACTFMTYAAKAIKAKHPEFTSRQFNDRVSFVTQEKEKSSEILGKLNMSFHGLNHKSFHGNTITEWKGKLGDYEGKVDYIFANPPYGLKDYGMEHAQAMSGKEGRWDYGVPKKGEGEYAFIQSIINLLNENGKAFVVLPLGTLFKDATQDARRKFLEEDIIEGIINLPGNMFKTTAIPVCIWIINKNKAESDRGKVFMIDASEECVKDGSFNAWKGDRNDKTIANYNARTVEEGFSEYVDFETLKANDYNLSVTRYVYTEEERESIDIHALNKKISNLIDEINRSSIETDKLFGGL